MQNYTTILGIIDMRQRKISYDDCRNRYGVGNSTITLIMNRFREYGKDLSALKLIIRYPNTSNNGETESLRKNTHTSLLMVFILNDVRAVSLKTALY